MTEETKKKSRTKSSDGLSEEDVFIVPELNIRIVPAWVRLIRFCQQDLRHGQICVKIVNSQPTSLVEEFTKRSIRFDKEESISDFGSVKFQ